MLKTIELSYFLLLCSFLMSRNQHSSEEGSSDLSIQVNVKTTEHLASWHQGSKIGVTGQDRRNRYMQSGRGTLHEELLQKAEEDTEASQLSVSTSGRLFSLSKRTVLSQLQVFPLQPNLEDESMLAKLIRWSIRTERKEGADGNLFFYLKQSIFIFKNPNKYFV